jgi:hypothetical protein
MVHRSMPRRIVLPRNCAEGTAGIVYRPRASLRDSGRGRHGADENKLGAGYDNEATVGTAKVAIHRIELWGGRLARVGRLSRIGRLARLGRLGRLTCGDFGHAGGSGVPGRCEAEETLDTRCDCEDGGCRDFERDLPSACRWLPPAFPRASRFVFRSASRSRSVCHLPRIGAGFGARTVWGSRSRHGRWSAGVRPKD